MTTIAITGASGFIGRHVVPLAVANGNSVRILSRTPQSVPGTTLVQGDITDPSAVTKLVRGAEILVHLAGVAHTALESKEDLRCARDVNIGGSSNVLQAACAAGVRRVVLVSSAHVYAGQEGIALREDAPQAAENVYAESKIAIERLANSEMATGLEIVIARPCLTYGAHVRYNLLTLMGAIRRGMYFHAGGKKVLRSFLSVHNASAAIYFLAKKGKRGEAYNIADQEPQSLEDFANRLAALMNCRKPRSIPYPVLATAAAGGSVLKPVWSGVPLTLESLCKLTTSFTLATEKLAAAGFTWPDDGSRAREEMVKAFLAEGPR